MKHGALGLGLAVLVAVGILGCQDAPTGPIGSVDATLSSHKPGHEPGGGGGGGGPPDGEEGCQVEFDLVLDDVLPVHSDGGGIYANGADRVVVFTGSSGPGFRFDTNGSQKLDARNDRRWVRLDFTGTAVEGIVAPGDLKGTDVRFSNQAPGLDLCGMEVGGSGTIGMDWPFEAADGDRYGLKYGGTTFSGNVCTAPKATVTRTSQTTWDVESGATACIVREGNILHQSVAMPFAFTITAQGAVS